MANWTPWKDRPYIPMRDGKAPPPKPAPRPQQDLGGYDTAGLAQLLNSGIVPVVDSPTVDASPFVPATEKDWSSWNNEPEGVGQPNPDAPPAVAEKTTPQVSSAPPQRAPAPKGPPPRDKEFQARLAAAGFGDNYEYYRSPFGRSK